MRQKSVAVHLVMVLVYHLLVSRTYSSLDGQLEELCMSCDINTFSQTLACSIIVYSYVSTNSIAGDFLGGLCIHAYFTV